jgi:hypothetical protein
MLYVDPTPKTRKTLTTLQQHHNSPPCVRAILDGVGATGAHSYCSSSNVRLGIPFRDAYSRHVPLSVESAVRRPPAPPPIAVCSTFLDWQPLRKRPLWTCQAPKIVGLDTGLT